MIKNTVNTTKEAKRFSRMPIDYKTTLNLPKTDFQMKADLQKKEPAMLKAWEDNGLYGKIMDKGKGRPKYILHDGPPYANGNIHMGHALNKILKDIIVKSRRMTGYSSDYVPGWDCHGLPIELQVEKELGDKKSSLSMVDVRKRCRQYAQRFVGIQREEFKRLGVFGEWDNPYLTMDFKYQATILRELGRFAKAGIVYKGKKPVHWCASCRTALAEAEVEYMDKTSPSVFVKFRVVDPKGAFTVNGEKGAFFVIWTTTPWTLPANLAIALHPELKYRLVSTPAGDLMLADGLIGACMEKFGFKKDEFVATDGVWTGAELDRGILCRHPWIERDSRVITGGHVTAETGTGCVHIAPGHGQEDYELGLRHGLEIYAPVDSSGRFTRDVPEFEGTPVFKANALIIELLRNNNSLIGKEDIRHSYPHCWRCKGPVIFRATEQWFASMDAGEAGEAGEAGAAGSLRRNALKAIEKDIQWIPSWGRERIYNMIAMRPDWCLSRQRAWGVPIPATRCSECGFSGLDGEIIEKLADAFEENGADVWFEKPLNEMLPKGARCKKCGSERLEKEEDILDVWFDSGVSFSAVLEKRGNLNFPADLYLEGSDQHRGWFHSSLLASIGTRNTPPYRAVLTHGFVVDGEGRKMSKSLGNVIAPQEVMDKYGAEVLRLWVAAEDYREDVRISEEILKRLSEAYRRIRNTFRFMLGNLYDFDPAKDMVPHDGLQELDRLTLHRLSRLIERVLSAYGGFEFHAVYHSVHNFCAVDLSAFYLDVIKDRLYTSKADSPERRAAQTTMHHVLSCLLRLTAPVLSFTTDEAWAFMNGRKEESVHLSDMPGQTPDWVDDRLSEKWDRLLGVKAEASKALEAARQQKKIIGHSLDAKVIIRPPQDLEALLKEESGALEDVMIVSGVRVLASTSAVDADEDNAKVLFYKSDSFPGLSILVEKAEGRKCERCWHITPEVGQSEAHPKLCERCVEALK